MQGATLKPFEDFSMRIARMNLAEYLWIHPGTEPPLQINDGGEPYEESAFVPVVERRKLSASELHAISSPWHWPSSSCISSFEINSGALSQMRRSEVANFKVTSEESKAMGDSLWRLLCDSSPLSNVGPMQWLGVSRRPSGLRTSTFNADSGRRLGLHLDGWDRLPLHSRHLARNRLCINLGLKTRSLLFLPYDIKTIDEAATQPDEGSSAQRGNVGGRYCSKFPETPVFEIEIPPGHAYLAPTENIIHDGCSERSSGADVTVAWLGLISYSGPFS
jgi:hypothetical protein